MSKSKYDENTKSILADAVILGGYLG